MTLCLANAALAQGVRVLTGDWVADMKPWGLGTATMTITNIGPDGMIEGSMSFGGSGYTFVFGTEIDAKSSPHQGVGNFTGTTLAITTADGCLYDLDLINAGTTLKGQFIRKGQPGSVRFRKR